MSILAAMNWAALAAKVRTAHFVWFAAHATVVTMSVLALVDVLLSLPLPVDPYKTAVKASILAFGLVLYLKHPVRAHSPCCGVLPG